MDLEILKIASDTENHKVLTDCTHSSKGKNPLCAFFVKDISRQSETIDYSQLL